MIAARLAAIEETFDDDCVRFFTPGSHEELAQAIMELYASPDKRRSLVEQASRRYDTVRWRETRGIYLAAVAKALEK